MMFRVTIARGYVMRTVDVEANNEPHARQIGESHCAAGERVTRATLLSRVTVDPSPRMPADHARTVANGGRTWCVRERFATVGQSTRVYDVTRDGVVFDTFTDRNMADALCKYRNADKA